MADHPTDSLVKAFGPGEDCPSLDSLIADIDGKCGDQARKLAETHLAGCTHCKTELAMYREFESGEVRPDETAAVEHIVARLRKNSPVERRPWWKAIWDVKVLAPASLVLVAAALILTFWAPDQHRPGPDISGTTFRSARITVNAPAGAIHEAPAEFRWEPVTGAASYEVRLSEVDNTNLWTAVFHDSKATLPDAIKANLLAPKVFNWRVTALNSAGSVIGDSGIQRVSVVH
jgi:hypothetical protein